MTDTAEPTPQAYVVDLTDIYIPANVDILVRVKDPSGEALFVIAPVAILAANDLAYIPDISDCLGRGSTELRVPECGNSMPHARHLIHNRPLDAGDTTSGNTVAVTG